MCSQNVSDSSCGKCCLQAIPASLQFSPKKRSDQKWLVPMSPSLLGKSYVKAHKRKYNHSLHVRRQDLKVYSLNPTE